MNFGNNYDREYNTNVENNNGKGRPQGYGDENHGYSNYGNSNRGYLNYDDRDYEPANRGSSNYNTGNNGGVSRGGNQRYAKNGSYPIRENEGRGRVAVRTPPPAYQKKPSGGRVVISTKTLVALVCLIVFLFTSFLIIAFLPSDDGKNKDNIDASAASGRVLGGDDALNASGNGDGVQGSAAGEEDDDKFVICIDPGHGYDDIGTSYKYLGNESEKDINLKVALLVVKNLRDKGYEVIMTRDSDTPPSDLEPNVNGDRVINPAWRCDFANSNKVDLFVSLHCNSFENDESVNGARIYYYADSKYGSSSLGNEISKAIQSGLSVEKPSVTGLGETEAYAVTKRVEAPSVLVEMGFATNKKDAENLTSATWQENMAAAISDGVVSYIEKNAN